MTRAKKSKQPVVVPFWKRISPGEWAGIVLGILAIAVATYLAYPSYVADSREIASTAVAQKQETSSDPGCGFPAGFVRDTLYVLITRFEDFENECSLECYGRGIERRIDELVQSQNLSIRFCYRNDLSPNQSRDADLLRDRFHADMIIWGKLQNAGPNCKADGFCLQFSPSDTLIHYAGGEVVKSDLGEFQRNISASDIEKGLISMGGKRFDDWLVGMFNLKTGKYQPDNFLVEAQGGNAEKAESYFTSGNIQYELGRYVEAITYFDRVIALEPKNASAYSIRGYAKHELGRYAEAIQDYDKAIEINPKNDLFFINRGQARIELGQYIKALEDFNKAIEIDPNFASAYNARGIGNATSGRNLQAIEDYNKAIKIDPRFDEAYYNRGISKDKLGRYVEAIADYDTAILLNPKYDLAYNNRGIIKGNSGRHLDAIADYDKAISINPKFDDAYYNRGIDKKESGQFAEAIADYDTAITINPKFASAFNNRAVCKRLTGQYRGAVIDFLHAVRLEPSRGWGIYLTILALIYLVKFKRNNRFFLYHFTRLTRAVKKAIRRTTA